MSNGTIDPALIPFLPQEMKEAILEHTLWAVVNEANATPASLSAAWALRLVSRWFKGYIESYFKDHWLPRLVFSNVTMEDDTTPNFDLRLESFSGPLNETAVFTNKAAIAICDQNKDLPPHPPDSNFYVFGIGDCRQPPTETYEEFWWTWCFQSPESKKGLDIVHMIRLLRDPNPHGPGNTIIMNDIFFPGLTVVKNELHFNWREAFTALFREEMTVQAFTQAELNAVRPYITLPNPPDEFIRRCLVRRKRVMEEVPGTVMSEREAIERFQPVLSQWWMSDTPFSMLEGQPGSDSDDSDDA